MNRLIFVVGLLTVALGFGTAILGQSVVNVPCPQTISGSLIGTPSDNVTATLVPYDQAVSVWGGTTQSDVGLLATYQLQPGLVVGQVAIAGFGGPTGSVYGLLSGYSYNADGSCTQSGTFSSTTSTASASSTATTTSSTSAKTGFSAFPSGISELLVVGGIVITGVGAFLKPFKKGVL